MPHEAGAVLSDPGRGNVSGADISGEAGPLPEALEPARIEVFTNPSAGQAVAIPVQSISTGIVDAVSLRTSVRRARKVTEAAGENPRRQALTCRQE